MDQTTVQIICGVLALVCVAVVVLRRRSKKKSTQDEEF